MKDLPIIFSAPMVKALLAKRKTMTRRLDVERWRNAPAGTRLWVREAHRFPKDGHGYKSGPVYYDADGARADAGRLRPSIHIPRWASRLTLIVQSVKIERLQDISEEDAKAEGVEGSGALWLCYDKSAPYEEIPRDSYRSLWRSLHGANSWDQNPEVAAITFRCIETNIDTLAKEAA